MNRPHVQELMRRACARHILIPAFNIAYLPMVLPVAETLKRLNTFGLLEVARPDVAKFGAESFAAVAQAYREEADPEFVGLHLDHIPAIDEDGLDVDWAPLIQDGLDLGYESVMIDGSRLAFEENVAVTRKVADMAHPNVAVEAELGAVLGHGAGPLPPYEELFRTRQGFTDPEQARRFARDSGADWLSIAAGNIHGAISGAAKHRKKVAARLDIDHLRTLAEAAGVPLVLHGGSGIQEEFLRRATRNGIAKINIATEIRQAYESALAGGRGQSAARDAVSAKVEELVVRVYGIADSRKALLE